MNGGFVRIVALVFLITFTVGIHNLKKILQLFCFSGLLSACATGPTPYNAERVAADDINSTVAALDNGKRALLTFGANWCSDSRKLAGAYAKEPLQSLLAKNVDVVFIDVGERDRNMDLAAQYKAPVMAGIPSVALVDSAGQILFSSQAKDLKNAANMSEQEIFEYFQKLLNQYPN